jgi:integrase
MRLDDLITEYVRSNPAITSDYTVKLLRGTVKLFSAHLGCDAEIEHLTDTNLKSYLAHRQRIGMAPATVEREGCKILTIWRYAASQGIVKAPTTRMARSAAHLPVAFLRYEVRALFKAARRARGECGGVPNKIFFPALLGLVWDSGERVGAIRALTWGDIDLRKGWVTFRVRKGRGAEMMKRVSWSTRRALRKLYAVHKDCVQPFAHVHLSTKYFHLKSILRDAGLPCDRRSMLHRLRRSHASYLKLAGGDAAASLGHSSEAITVRAYYDPRVVASRQPISLLFNPVGLWSRLIGFFGLELLLLFPLI